VQHEEKRKQRPGERAKEPKAWRKMKYGIRTGLRAGNHRWVDRGVFLLPPGNVGTIIRADKRMIAILIDAYVPGAEDWNNEIQFTPDDLGFEYDGGQIFTNLEDLFNYYFLAD